MKKQLKSFLELPDVFNKILDYQLAMENSEPENALKNLIQGSLWKSFEVDKKRIVFPLIIYFDDFEVGNPLGTHAGRYKIGAIYYSIATIPPEYSSRLENIFVACLFHSSDRSRFDNQTVLKPLIDELLD